MTEQTGQLDPKDLESLKQALAAQGALVGQHDKVLRDMSQRLTELSANMLQLGNQMARLSTQLSAPASQATAPPPAPAPSGNQLLQTTFREPHMPTPERYSGDLGACGRFLLQCSLVFDLQPTTYSTDKSRIAFVLSLLTGKASQWATACWESESDIFQSYDAFTKEMKSIFDHPLKGKEAAKRLLMLSQGSSPVAQYAVDFKILATESGWDDTALQAAFMKGLADNVKDELAARDETENLQELISLATRLDNRLRERRREKTSRPVTTRGPSSPHLVSTVPSVSTSPPVFSSLPNPVPTEEPMQLGRAHLSATERLRRQKSGLCMYCGQDGHFIGSCPLRPKDKAHQ